MKAAEPITPEKLKSQGEDYLKSEKDAILRHALSATRLNDVVTSLDAAADRDFSFSVDLKTMPVTNQKKSGRCWIFSAANLLREMIAKKAGIKDMFEISQNYIAFYDKLEKINYVMEAVIDMIDRKPDDRKLMFVLQNGVGDGGQWDMFVNIVKKYGVVPKASMVETFQSENTHDSDALINAGIRSFAAEAQRLFVSKHDLAAVKALKNDKLRLFYNLLADCFGVPPAKFDFEYTDSAGKYHIEKGYTPKSFFEKYVGSEIDEYVSIINAPTADKPYMQTYNIEYLGNVVGGKEVTHLNLPLARFREIIASQLRAGDLVWFGSDVSSYGQRESGVWDDRAFDYVTPFGISLSDEKSDMLDYHASAMNHAMVLTGFDEKGGKIVRWKVENSWGDQIGTKGMFVMSGSFFDLYVYQAAVRKSFLTEEERAAFTKKPVLLSPWDPFGTLAD